MLEIRLLGPVEVLRDGRAVPLGGAKQRALVADLALHANEVVSADRLIDDVWGDEPPDTAAHMLHVYVSRLRKTLEDHGRVVLETRAPGYVLNLAPQDDLDADRFESHVRRGREALDSRPAEALATFDEALASWRGRALEEFAHEAFAQPAAARLEELRQSTQEGRAEALLALGRHDDALAELEALISRFPLRERLRELQMLALYRAGRQGDALQVLQSARRTLAEELGVDPGPGLVSLEQAILRQDPALEAPPTTSRAGAASTRDEARPVRPGRRSAWTAVIGATAVAAVLTVVVLVVMSGESPPAPGNGGVEPDIGDGQAIRWTEMAPGAIDLGGDGDQRMLGGIETEDGLLAVGKTARFRESTKQARDYDAAVWIQTPPNDWRLVDDDDFAATGNQEATDAVAIDGGFVVFGFDASFGDLDAAIWTSVNDGVSWSRFDPLGRGVRIPGDQSVRGVSSTGSEIIAVGFTRIAGDENAAVWASEDPTMEWALVITTSLDEPGDQQMSSVTRFGDLIVAGGFSEGADGRDAAVWTSSDGRFWDRSTGSLGGPGDQKINAIVVGGPGLVAVGEEIVDGDRNGAVWTSTDGATWRRVPDSTGALGGDGSQQMSAIAFWDEGLVAAGQELLGGADGALWLSPDGTTWSRVPRTSTDIGTLADFGRQGVRALLVTEDALVALGWEGRGGDDDADVWIGRR